MRIPILLLGLPVLAMAGTFSGQVTFLDGTPLAGAALRSRVDATVSASDGTWSLSRSTGIVSRRLQGISVSQQLVAENGRIRMRFAGLDASGRKMLPPVIPQQTTGGSARALDASSLDTVGLYWRGKRLVVLSIASTDSSGILLKVDTGWSDDAGIPWNPRTKYGSLVDARDGQVYRTVVIGTHNWMAQNLNFAGAGPEVGLCYARASDSCTRYGRLYDWDEAMNGSASSITIPSGVQGVCPAGWHLPSDSEWSSMLTIVEPTNTKIGTKLQSTSGWSPIDGVSGGTDNYGFRALPGGASIGYIGGYAYWWTTMEATATGAYAWEMYFYGSYVSYYYYKTDGFSVRCMQN